MYRYFDKYVDIQSTATWGFYGPSYKMIVLKYIFKLAS